jgi:hypothetical protein
MQCGVWGVQQTDERTDINPLREEVGRNIVKLRTSVPVGRRKQTQNICATVTSSLLLQAAPNQPSL